MKTVTIEFGWMTLIFNVPQQFVVCIDWLGNCERISMERFFTLVETEQKRRSPTAS